MNTEIRQTKRRMIHCQVTLAAQGYADFVIRNISKNLSGNIVVSLGDRTQSVDIALPLSPYSRFVPNLTT